MHGVLNAHGRHAAAEAPAYEQEQSGTPGGEQEGLLLRVDAHGSVSMLLNEAGEAQASYGYSAYGKTDEFTTRENGPAGDELPKDPPLNSYRYTDKRLDPGCGTLDMGFRRFGPETSRFPQEDVYDDALHDLDLSEDPLTGNRYPLAGGNPVSFVEVDGHMLARDSGGELDPKPKRRSSGSRRQSSASGGGPQGTGRIDSGKSGPRRLHRLGPAILDMTAPTTGFVLRRREVG